MAGKCMMKLSLLIATFYCGKFLFSEQCFYYSVKIVKNRVVVKTFASGQCGPGTIPGRSRRWRDPNNLPKYLDYNFTSTVYKSLAVFEKLYLDKGERYYSTALSVR